MLDAFRKAGSAAPPEPLDVAPPSAPGRRRASRARRAAPPVAVAKLPLLHRLFEPVDVASLVVFRIAFGAIMLYQAARYLANGWVERFVAPVVQFTFFGFEWVRPWPGNGMYLHFAALAVLAVCIMLGLGYRLATVLFFLGYGYVFLLDPVRYQNHVYLMCLISLLLIFIPAHRAFSVDAWLRPAVRSDWAPAWALWLLRIQVGLPHFYGGVAKVNEDWLRGEPLRRWFANRAEWQLFAPLATQEWAVYLFSYAGLLLDLLIVPLLIWRRTRVPAFIAAVAFHLMNVYLFNIGIFPWFMIAATFMFFDPDWPRGLLHRLGWRGGSPAALRRLAARRPALPAGPLRPAQRVTVALLAAYLAVQLLAPLRHFLYPSNVDWSEEGYHYAWRMKLTAKDASARFFATDPATNSTWEVDRRPYLTRPALTRSSFEEIARRPDLTLQFSHHIADDLRRRGYPNVEVRAVVQASMNGRPRQYLIDPNANLAGQPRTLAPASWIVPLEPLDRPTVPRWLDWR